MERKQDGLRGRVLGGRGACDRPSATTIRTHPICSGIPVVGLSGPPARHRYFCTGCGAILGRHRLPAQRGSGLRVPWPWPVALLRITRGRPALLAPFRGAAAPAHRGRWRMGRLEPDGLARLAVCHSGGRARRLWPDPRHGSRIRRLVPTGLAARRPRSLMRMLMRNEMPLDVADRQVEKAA